MSFARPELLWLLLLLIPLSFALVFIQKRYERRLQLLTRREFQPLLLPAWALRKPWFSWVLILTAVAALILALARPRYGFEWKDVKKHGADVVIVLDVSRSMNAADIDPSRLVRAKREIMDLMKVVHGDRLGLVLFAGVGFIQCPLTQDMNAFSLFLEQVDSDSIPVQGTSMGQAIRLGMQALQDGTEAGSVGKAMILISDGEDQDTDPLVAAKAAAGQGIAIHTISVGGQGAPIPLPDGGFLKDESGSLVVSHPDETILRQIAEASGGHFLRSETGEFGLDRLYRESIRPPLKETEQSQRERVWNEVHPWLTGLAIFLFLSEVLQRQWRSRKRRPEAARKETGDPALSS
ncbi:MAG TPA: VWA domain-containing protein [Oligoflexus sp.]|uniref:VWA domain-containing protein n=1 Tax=Oligoflexus sp. TaxID=1971216 RepID=UPI002D7ECA2C|nr:VWA domain-containing protein [Oligoflexus sp.]HET9237779.1 VWA domain-containing protein [Oligoflexus sp.]